MFVDKDYLIIHYWKKVLFPSSHIDYTFVDVLKTETGQLLHSFQIDRDNDPRNHNFFITYFGGKLAVLKKEPSYQEPVTFRYTWDHH